MCMLPLLVLLLRPQGTQASFPGSTIALFKVMISKHDAALPSAGERLTSNKTAGRSYLTPPNLTRASALEMIPTSCRG